MRSSIQRSIACLVFVGLCTLPVLAQSDRASIVGRVTDPNDLAVAGAKVKITNVATGSTFEATTDEEGRYVVPAILKAGRYRVEATAQGFKTAESEEVTLQIGDVREVSLKLELGQVTERVTVSAEAPQLETETSSRGEVITGRQITELPLKDRNFTQLATLTPGVNRAFVGVLVDQTAFNQGDPNAGQVPGLGNEQGSSEASRFSRSGGASLTVNGLRPTSNNFSLDGVDNNEPQFGTIGVFPNPDAIAEFKVETSVAKAEVGRGGATINTSYQSGTNELHGSVFYYGQNDALNATPWRINRERFSNPTLRKSIIRVHEFGFTVGGPIIKNKTFFFGDYLGQRNRTPFPFHTGVPTARSRMGDFSEFPFINANDSMGNPIPLSVTNPNSCNTPGNIASGGCEPFTNNIIPNLQSLPLCPSSGSVPPTNCFSSQAFRLLDAYPLPNTTQPSPNRVPNNSGNFNYTGLRDNRETIDAFDIKIDHRFSNSNNLLGRYSQNNQQRVRGNFFPVVPTAGFGAGEEVGDTRQVVVSDTHVFKPTLLNEIRFGWTQIEIGIFNCGVGGSCGINPSFCEDIGIPNCNKGTLPTTGGILTGGFDTGEFEFTGDGGLFLVKSNNFYVADSVTIISGKHTWKTGLEVRRRQLETIDGGRSGGLKGHIQYSGAFASQGTSHVQADYLLGRPAVNAFSGSVLGGPKPFELRGTEWSFFVQDDWKFTPTLTFNLGVRYDVFPGYHEVNDRVANFDPVGQRIIQGGNSIETDFTNVGPRIGFAWNFGPDHKLVLRGGYGIFYVQDGLDYPPVIRNAPVTSSVQFGTFTGSPQVFNLTTGPPVAPIVEPAVLTGNSVLFAQQLSQKTASVNEWNLTFQWEFARDWVFDLAYVGTRGRNLLATRQIGNNNNGLGFARTPGGTPIINVTAYENRASSNYDGLQLKLEKRFAQGFEIRSAYTWSHNIDDSTGVFQGAGDERGSEGGPINPLDLRRERASSSLDRRHVFSTNLIWDLPFGKGKWMASDASGAREKFVGGWQANFIFSAQTGQHFSPRLDVSSGGSSRPDLVLGCNPRDNLAPGRFLNISCFAAPAQSVINLAGKQIFFGNVGRNSFTGPGFFRTDLSFFKNTSFGSDGRYRVQFGIELFNAWNQVHNIVPNNNFSDPSGFGRFDNALAPRTMQYRLKIFF